MKKTFFTLILLAVVSFMSAQTMQFECNGEVYQDGQQIVATFEEFEYVTKMHIRNLTDHELLVFVEQEVVEEVEGSMAYMCWDQCLAPGNFLVDGPVSIPAQTLSDNELSCHVMFEGEELGIVKATYSAYDRANPDERISITVLFGQNANTEEHTLLLGQAYPNPASSWIHFDYSNNNGSVMNAVVYNLLGQEVKSQTVSGAHGRINIAVDDLQPGIYFCSIRVDNNTVKTEKFIVKR